MGTLDTVQQEQLRAIGNYLSQVRQEQDRSLEDIAAKTYIPLRLLKAIEAAQEKPLPEPVFIQGFIRRYADTLGLDGMDLSQKFPVHVTPLPIAPTAVPSRELRAKNAAEPTSYVSSATEVDEPPRQALSPRPATSFLPYIAAAGLLAVGGIALGIVRAISSRQPEPPQQPVVLPKQPSSVPDASPAPPKAEAVKPTPQAAASALPPTASPSPAGSPSPTVTPLPSAATSSNAPVSVQMNLTDASWVQVIVDGEVKAEAVLPKGTQRSWSGKQEITILAGNAGAVSVAANGNPAKPMGARGDVEELTVKPR